GLVDLNTETYDWIDKLVYTYPSAHSSQLSKVQDLSTGAGQPIGLKPIESKLSYNAAGAITYDMGKGLNTSYNEINLPKAVTDGSKFVNFDYTFSGEKIRRKGDGTEGYTQVNYFQGAEVYDGVLQSYYHPEGRIRFEDVNTQHLEFTLQDHLGNSVVTFEDINQDGEIVTETDPGTLEVYQRHYYYPFGLEMKGEWTQDGSPKMLYRYNGKEFLSDVGSNMLDYGARYHMPEIGRWGAVDPMASKYPSLSPYAYVANDPINAIDPDGRYILPAALAQKYSKLAGYLQNGIGNLLNRKDIRSGLRTIGNFNDDQIDQLARYGEGIPIDIKQLDNDAEHSTHGEINGYTPGNGSIQIDETLAQQLQDASTPEAEAAALLGVVSTILHETTHQGFNTNPVPYNSASREITDGNFSRTYNPNKDLYSYYFQGNQVGTSGETGEAFENSIWYNGGKNTNFGFDRKQGTTGMQNQSRLYKINFFTGNYNNLPETSNK
ncbi:MAG: RHS repeat-associated core domain-containing protein, partial [Saprospiraceae bacterium]